MKECIVIHRMNDSRFVNAVSFLFLYFRSFSEGLFLIDYYHKSVLYRLCNMITALIN
jgi:hypothetical protein